MLTPQQKASREARLQKMAEASHRQLVRSSSSTTPPGTPMESSKDQDFETKLAARKRKNRESAQYSRNLQKQRMMDLESEIAAIRAENARLQGMVVDLTSRNEALAARTPKKIEESSPEITCLSQPTSSPAVPCSFSPQLEARRSVILRFLLSLMFLSPPLTAYSAQPLSPTSPSPPSLSARPPLSSLLHIHNSLRHRPSSSTKPRRRRLRPPPPLLSRAGLPKSMAGLSKKLWTSKATSASPTLHPSVERFLQKWASRLSLPCDSFPVPPTSS